MYASKQNDLPNMLVYLIEKYTHAFDSRAKRILSRTYFISFWSKLLHSHFPVIRPVLPLWGGSKDFTVPRENLDFTVPRDNLGAHL